MSDQDTIFLLAPEGTVQRIPHRQFDSEDLFQTLIERHPEILVGEQIDPEDPPRWLLIQREAGIPGEHAGVDRWAIDHLLLDQNGRPTLVEVKRSTDTRLRREVVGQMLDYAANALEYWPSDRIRDLAARIYGGPEQLDIKIDELLNADGNQEIEITPKEYWERVEQNLRNGEVRLLFVADAIPTELRRVIEFLNDHMPRVEVLGVEIRHYENDSIRALVPRVVGQTEFARQSKSRLLRRKKISRSEFLDMCSPTSRPFFEFLLTKADKHGAVISWNVTGFSLRALRSSGGMVTLGYGVIRGSYPYAEDDCVFQICLNYLTESEKQSEILESLGSRSCFVKHGSETYNLLLDKVSSRDPEEVLDFIWALAEQIQETG